MSVKKDVSLGFANLLHATYIQFGVIAVDPKTWGSKEREDTSEGGGAPSQGILELFTGNIHRENGRQASLSFPYRCFGTEALIWKTFR